jgi:hypothetical protein
VRTYRIELLKFSMIHNLRLSGPSMFFISEGTNRSHRELSGMRELWQPVRADCNSVRRQLVSFSLAIPCQRVLMY